MMRVIEQLAGVGLPASLWESQILPARVRDYSSEMLDELLATGAVIWSGQKKLGEDDGLVALHLQEYAAESFTPAEADQANRSALQQAIVAVLADGGAWFAQQISQRIRDKTANRLISLPCKRLMGAGLARRHHQRHWAPLRALTRSSSNARTSTRRSHRARRGRPVYAQPVSPLVSYNTPNLAGRWSLLQVEPLNDTERMLALAENMLDRYGIISRQAVIAENIPAGFHRCKRFVEVWKTPGELCESFCRRSGWRAIAERLTMTDCAIWRHKPRKRATIHQWRSLPTIRLMCGEIFCPGLHIRQRWFQRVGRVRWWSFLAANCYSIWRKVAKKCWSGRKKRNTRPRGFPRADYRTASRTTAALYANRSE
ncbi:ATP-dependent helicase [Escherichia coli]|nr:ATP-dependent helicase [Escherichia coli]